MAEMASKREVKVAKEEKRPWPVKLIVTHNRPHFDEVLAIFMLKKWGEDFFPGVGEAEVEAWSEGGMLDIYKKAGKTADDLLREEKVLAVGTCGGMFDEHGKEAPTCAHLVVEYLGITAKPELQQILQFCKRVDHDGHSMPFDIHSLIKTMYDFYGDQDDGLQVVLNWAMQAIEGYVYGQQQFFTCELEFARTGRIIEGPIRITAVESDNPQMNKWIRWKFDSPEVIIQRRATGHTAIFTVPKKKPVEIRDIVRIVRTKELLKRKIPPSSWQALEIGGLSADCPCWYFYPEGGQLLNGSLTASEVEPTRLSLTEIAGAVALACGPLINECREERCIGQVGQRCENYRLGFLKCRRRRYEQYKQKNVKKN